MQIHLVANDRLEADGIRWIVESHLSGAVMTTFSSMDNFIKQVDKNNPDLLILDMDAWKADNESVGELLQQEHFRWIGISSERIFQTAYRGLRFHAEDVLFRPFSPTDLIKQIQQVRFRLRNAQRQNAMRMNSEVMDASIDYADLFFLESERTEPITMAAFLPKQTSMLPLIYDELQRFPFTKKHQFFALTDFILCVQDTKDKEFFQEEYRTFLAQWKEQIAEPLAIVFHESTTAQSIKKTYELTKQRTEEIFFEGYDIILSNDQQVQWLPMDPLLTPLEQREWIEMLETRDMKRIRHWVEKEFLTYKRPYPDPEMVRIRMTSVLAQIRRYMKSYQLQTEDWESAYYTVFQQIVQSPIIYEMVQDLLAFTIRLISDETANLQLRNGEQSLVEKTRALIEANYWDAGWGLADCAEALRINKSTLSRRFATESDQSFRIVLHRVRIEEAKRLLQETDLSIEEISRLVGYAHQSYFSAKFKQFENCTPFAYRMR